MINMKVELENVDKTITLRWIPVEEALPPINVNVLVCLVDHRRKKVSEYGGEYKSSIRIDKLMSYDGHDFFWSKWNSPSVVAWMPLPEPPVMKKLK